MCNILDKFDKKSENRSIKADGILGIIAVALTAFLYIVKNCVADEEGKALWSSATIVISILLLSDLGSTFRCINELKKIKREGEGKNISGQESKEKSKEELWKKLWEELRIEFEKITLSLGRGKIGKWIRRITIVAYIIVGMFFLDDVSKWIDNLADIVAIIGVVSVAMKNYCNYILERYIENVKDRAEAIVSKADDINSHDK